MLGLGIISEALEYCEHHTSSMHLPCAPTSCEAASHTGLKWMGIHIAIMLQRNMATPPLCMQHLSILHFRPVLMRTGAG